MLRFSRDVNALVDNKNTQAHEYRSFYKEHSNEFCHLHDDNSFILPETLNLFLYNTLRSIGFGMVQTESLYNYLNGFGSITYNGHLISTEYDKGNMQNDLNFEISDIHCPLLVGFKDASGDEPEFHISSTDQYYWDNTLNRIIVVLMTDTDDKPSNNYPFCTEPTR